MCLRHTEVRVNIWLALQDTEKKTEAAMSLRYKLKESGPICVKKIGNRNRHHIC